MDQTTQEFLVLFGVVGAVGLFLLFKSRSGAIERLNADPNQHELAMLTLEFANSSMDEEAQTLFRICTLNVFMRSLIGDRGEQQTRMAHALSLVRPNLTPIQFEQVRLIVRVW